MSKYPIKMLSDEQGTPFVPLVTPDSIYTVDDEGFEQVIGKKLEADNLIEGEYINIEKDGNNCTISAELPVGLTVINNLTTAGSGYGVLDAYQGKVLKDSIPTIVDNLESDDANKVLSANQGRILDGKTVPTGGATGQVLKKASDNDHELEWGDAADPNAIVGDGTIMSIVELSYADYKALEAAGELKADTEYHITDVENGTASYITEEQIQEMIDDLTDTKFDLQKATILEDGTDLNNVTTPGTYRSLETATTATMSNVPVGQTSGFVLLVCIDAGQLGSNLRQELFRDERIFIRYSNDYGENWSEWQVVCGYKVGDIIITGSGDNPSTRMGGQWVLIDKEFESYQYKATDADEIASYITLSENCSVTEFVVRRIGHTICFRIYFTTLVEFADTQLDMGTLNFSALGIKGLSYQQSQIVMGSDGGNGLFIINVSDGGNINCVDVIPKGTATTMDSGSTPRLYYQQTIPAVNMLESACNKFYWQRTA